MDNTTGEDQSSGNSPLSELVGEGKKYKTVEDLAKSRVEADNFIEQLKREKAEIEQRMTNLQVDAEKARQTTSTPAPKTSEQVSSENLQALIDKRIGEHEHSRIQSNNLDDAKNYLVQNFGSDAEGMLERQAKEMGVTKDYLFGIASDSPSLFKRMFPSKAPMTQNTTSGTQNTETAELQTNTQQPSGWDELREQRKKMGAGKFYNEPSNFQKLVAAKKAELQKAAR